MIVGAVARISTITPTIEGIVPDGYRRVSVRGHVGHVQNNVFSLRAYPSGTLRISGPGMPTRHFRFR